MTVHLPTIKQLQYLVALNEHGHFGRAAEQCFVTQSTLSAGIRELENLLDVVLVERTRRVVRFTALGEKIAGQAREVLREAQILASMAQAEGKPLTGELRMGVIPTIAPFLLPALLPHLRKNYPDLKLFLREETSQASCEALHRGQLDCVLLALPYACGEVESAEIYEDHLYIAYPEGEAPPASAIAPAEIEEGRLLLLEDGHCLKDHALSACNRPEIRASASMMGTSLHTLVQMVDNGLGLTFVPEMALHAGILDHTGIEARKLEADHASRRVALAWRKQSPRGEEFTMLAETLRELTKKLANA
ncbi:hydrogen peroxide-inducible genes activator [Sphingomicrobium marinum]|uniref:hydrogen peroxide-inducible genes activator n=1 Tax=Sphingomicrobium marinum TaxID=1227950 RepID=UPI00223F772D|nr:hydrogen peroxide-inducible genes activator [Sphingomicrobium marinum]